MTDIRYVYHTTETFIHYGKTTYNLPKFWVFTLRLEVFVICFCRICHTCFITLSWWYFLNVVLIWKGFILHGLLFAPSQSFIAVICLNHTLSCNRFTWVPFFLWHSNDRGNNMKRQRLWLRTNPIRPCNCDMVSLAALLSQWNSMLGQSKMCLYKHNELLLNKADPSEIPRQNPAWCLGLSLKADRHPVSTPLVPHFRPFAREERPH